MFATAVATMPSSRNKSRKAGRPELQALFDKFCGGSSGTLKTACLARAVADGMSANDGVAGAQEAIEVPWTSGSPSRADACKVYAHAGSPRRVGRAKDQMKFVNIRGSCLSKSSLFYQI